MHKDVHVHGWKRCERRLESVGLYVKKETDAGGVSKELRLKQRMTPMVLMLIGCPSRPLRSKSADIASRPCRAGQANNSITLS